MCVACEWNKRRAQAIPNKRIVSVEEMKADYTSKEKCYALSLFSPAHQCIYV